MQKAFLVFFLVLTALGPARAESIASTIKKFGMIGELSLDCAAPAGDGHAARLSYIARSDGSVVHERKFKDRSESGDKITAATITPEGLLELKLFYPRLKTGQQRRTIAFRKLSPTSYRTIYNYDSTGRYTVKDGKFTESSKDEETPVQHKCD